MYLVINICAFLIAESLMVLISLAPVHCAFIPQNSLHQGSCVLCNEPLETMEHFFFECVTLLKYLMRSPVESLPRIAVHSMKEYFRVAYLNHTSQSPPLLCSEWQPSSSMIPTSIKCCRNRNPHINMTSIIHNIFQTPSEVHFSCQKEAFLPSFTSTYFNCFAISQHLSILFHIHEPIWVFSFTIHIQTFLMRYNLILTKIHFDERILHRSFKQHFRFVSFNGLIPKPPSCFVVQISFQAILAFLPFNCRPDPRNADHRISISFTQPIGSLKAAIRIFVRLVITDLIS